MLELRALQRELYKAITDPERVSRESAKPLEAPLAGVIRSDQRLPADARVKIYADAYLSRLLQCLREDFPATLAVVGEERFGALVADYLAACPPNRPSVSYVGRFLDEFLHRHPFAERWPFVADLAKLEWTIIEVFQAPDGKTLDPEAMRAIAPEEWPTVTLRAHPALRLIECDFVVTDVLRAVQAGGAWAEPGRRETSVMVWRSGGSVCYRELDGGAEAAGLGLVMVGATMAAVCEAVLAECEGADPVSEIDRLLRRWLAEGVLGAVD